MYINLANVRMLGVRSPAVTVEQLDLAFFGDHPDVPPYVAHPDDERPELVPGIVEHLGWVMSTTEWPEIDCERDETIAFRTARPDLAALDDDELLARARSTLPMLHKLFESHTVSSSSSAIAPGILAAIGAAIGDPTIPMKLVAGIGHVDSAEPSYQMWDLSRIVRRSPALTEIFDAGHDGLLERLRSSDASTELLAGFDQLIADHGCRGPNEWEISCGDVGDPSGDRPGGDRPDPSAVRRRVTGASQPPRGHRAGGAHAGGARQGRTARRRIDRSV